MNNFFLVNCEWGEWGSWNTCSKTCGGGEKTKTRSKTVTEAYGGTCMDDSSMTEQCNTNSCPGEQFKMETQNLVVYE